MECKAAVLYGTNQDWAIETVTVDPPRAGELIVEWHVAGLCHSDEHLVTGEMIPPEEAWDLMGIESPFFPVLGGHEGAGVVVEIGPGVTSVAPGDHVAASFVPACGHCHYCASGQQNVCDQGAGAFTRGMITDGTCRHHVRLDDGNVVDLRPICKLGTFSQYACVAESSVIKVEPDFPLEVVALVSCGVATGWGSATKRGDVRPGDTVVVVGTGGVGMNAVQGAHHAGAERVVAVDPVVFKREKAMEFGATHTFASMEEALPAVAEMTWGRMADVVILTPGVMYGDLMNVATKLAGKWSTVVVTAAAPITQDQSAVNLFELGMFNKEIKGTIFGSLNPRADIPRLLGMYASGALKVDELITQRYTLEDINLGYKAMRAGDDIIRGVVIHDVALASSGSRS